MNGSIPQEAVSPRSGSSLPLPLLVPPALSQAPGPYRSPGGGTASLVQRQVARIEDRTEVVRRNRELADRMHRRTLQLLALDSAAERIERLRVSLRRDFSV